MPGVTVNGYPYAVPTDPLVQWPATSQSLADKLEASATSFCPIGTIVAFAGTAPLPVNWKICDGTNGTPDLRGKFILGASDARPAGTGGGAETVALTTAQMPSHSHGGATGADNAAHVHTYAGPEGQAGIDPGVLGWDANMNNIHTATGRVAGQVTDSSGTAANHTHVIPGEGGGAAHENMPPYYALVYIMRVA